MNVAGRTIVVIGLGESGMAASAFLARRGARVIATDVKREEDFGRAKEALEALRAAGVRVVLGAHPPELLRTADAIILSPGVPPTLAVLDEARRAGVPILSEVELAARFLKGILIGITGTNGKTTVTAWIGDLLARCGYCAHVGGNIGRALIRLVEEVHDAHCFLVAELSSFQLELTETLHPRVAVVTNIAPDHLDRHGSLEAYIAAKRRIFRHQTEADWAVLNADDPTVRAMADATRARVLFFSRRADRDLAACGVFLRDDRLVLRWGEKSENSRAAPTFRCAELTMSRTRWRCSRRRSLERVSCAPRKGPRFWLWQKPCLCAKPCGRSPASNIVWNGSRGSKEWTISTTRKRPTSLRRSRPSRHSKDRSSSSLVGATKVMTSRACVHWWPRRSRTSWSSGKRPRRFARRSRTLLL
ncbi:MAG: UDP-N-acetylmuramoyl-L-alanine--D-glutamate ligase [Acidobacteriota bacterium]|nr:UDP-N-acetylmuramoyl-L-alanine--D-glutamate ligase [Acidobacteriota bacterium]